MKAFNDTRKIHGEGKVTEQQITTAVEEFWKLSMIWGFFDDPYRYTDEKDHKAEVFQ